MGQPSVSKELGEHGQRARGKRLVDEWLLPVQSLKSGTAGQRVFARVGIDDFRVNSLTVRKRFAFLRLRALIGWPRTYCPLAALLPRSSQ